MNRNEEKCLPNKNISINKVAPILPAPRVDKISMTDLSDARMAFEQDKVSPESKDAIEIDRLTAYIKELKFRKEHLDLAQLFTLARLAPEETTDFHLETKIEEAERTQRTVTTRNSYMN